MGLLDSVVGALSGAQGGQGNPLLDMAMQLISKQSGGLGGLVQSFQQGGLGDIVNSWVSSGHNLPISAEQLQSVFSGGQLQALAAQFGMSSEQVSGGLAQLLPQVVDKLTPGGHLPQDGGGDLLSQGLDMLKKGGLFG